MGEINGNTDWSEALKEQRVIVHTAARAHIMADTAADPLTEFRSVNVAGTLNLAHQAAKALPLPLGAIHNKRSLVALDKLVDLIITCIDCSTAANQVFTAGDGQDVSTTELLRGVGRAMGKPARLIPAPAGMLMFSAGLLGKKAVAQRLLGSLQVDISKNKRGQVSY